MSTSNVSPPVAELDKASEPTFYVVSVKKLLIMLFFTWGVYGWYWTYRNWATYRRATGARVTPILRTLFDPLFVYVLLKRVDHGLRSRGMNYKWSPALLAFGIIGAAVLPLISLWFDPGMRSLYGLTLASLEAASATLPVMSWASLPLFVLHFWLMAVIQRAINTHDGDPRGVSNNRLTLANWLWMPGSILVLALIGFLVVFLAVLAVLL